MRGIVKAPLTEIKDDSFIGVTGMPQSDGKPEGVEVHFPKPMRGTGRVTRMGPNAQQHHHQRHRNAYREGVRATRSRSSRREGEKESVVTPETMIVTYVPTRSEFSRR